MRLARPSLPSGRSALAVMQRLPGAPLAWGATAALAGFALWLRLRQLGYYGEMGIDQSITINMALEWLHGGPLPLTSMKSSAGVFNPPLAEYLYALALAVWPSVLSLPWVIALVNLAGLAGAGLATARVFGWRVGWWATLLFCVNPWVVHYSRTIWMQNFVPGFAALLFACVLLYFAHRPRPAYLVLAAVFLSATIQVHMSAAVLSLTLLVVGVCDWRRVKARSVPLIVGAVLYGLSFAPYLIYQFRTNFADLESLRATLSQSPSETNLAPALIVLDLLQSKGVYATLGSAAGRWQALDPWGAVADGVVTGVFGLAVLVVAAQVAAHVWSARLHFDRLSPGITAQWIMLLWLAIPVFFNLRHSYYLQNYYFTYLLPAPFVLMALLSDNLYAWLAERLRFRLAQWASGVALAAFLPLALIAYQQSRLVIIGQAILAEGSIGRQRVIDVHRAVTFAQQLMAARPDCQLVVMSEGARFDGSRFGLLSEFVDPKRVRFVEAGAGYLLPEPCAVYFLVVENAQARTWLDVNARPLDAHTIRTPEETWTFFDLSATGRQAALSRLLIGNPLAQWEEGIQLLDFDVQGEGRPGGSLRLVSTWEVVEMANAMPPREIHFGSYLLDKQNNLWAQVDGPGMDSTQWRAGDVFQVVFPLELPADLPPGAYSLATALYLYPDVQRLPLMDGGDLLHLQEFMIQ